ncbi:methylated-DNA--[protein]-cysteine S-methyltransferase [uncultured Streptococcus sp.]|uniref:methylated-DNA--[protein]-cysteine S-methyltransferase n=1 Tax=uncultured Streptococcus sp. TaxID=83427 RepID=UPI0027DE820F|nr:methylated-DNA--[protein]-cysteine S-methyltransferase [uncultured Streptococcus sp.]
MLYQDLYDSPLGAIRILANEQGICGLYFVGQKYDCRGFEVMAVANQSTSHTKLACDWLEAYFAGAALPEVTLALTGTDFQMKVWRALQDIPSGQTVTYGQLAKLLDCKSAQAIGGAIGKNPVSLIVPCHRVLGADGGLTGYAGGVERKAWLLKHEERG